MPRTLIDDRRGRILAASRELVLSRGWPDTTIAAIAARAGIGKGAVYLEFADKRAVLAALLAEGTRGLAAAVRRRVVEHDGILDLATAYRFGVEALLDDPLMLAVQLDDQSVLGDHVRTAGAERYARRIGWLDDYIVDLQEAGLLDPQADPDHVALVLGVFTLGLAHAPGSLGDLTPERLSSAVALFAAMVDRGLASPAEPDRDAVRAAHLRLLARLDAHLKEETA